ncbi:MAG: PAS domain-containing protein [Pirellulaceae bacterium]
MDRGTTGRDMSDTSHVESDRILDSRELTRDGPPTRLQTVIDAFPDPMMVVDRNCRIVLANRAARETSGIPEIVSAGLRCYEVPHRRETACAGDGETCPIQEVVTTRAPVRITHTRTDSEGREIFVEVTAAPIFDASGEVVQVVETCRDITERKLSRRFLEIGNRHMEMKPLLEEATVELKKFTGCAAVGIRVLDEEKNRLSDLCHLCGCEALALVPICLGDRTLGLIHVTDRRRNMVSASKVKSLERLAVHLGAAMQRVQSAEALRAAHDHLEATVQQRTTELTEANHALQDEITERTRLEREILHVSSEEQRRIGQELHDGLGQELTGLGYLAQSLSRKLQAKGSVEAEIAADLARYIRLSFGQIKNIVRGLIPLEICADELEFALQTLAANIEQQTGISCRFVSNGNAPLDSDDTAIQIYRIAQEAVANAVKHADAREIVVALTAERDLIRLEVRDDGVGIRADAEEASGYGLRSMKYRARALGGEFEVRRMARGGTLVSCCLSQDSSDAFEGEDCDA